LTIISNVNNETGKIWNNGTVDISNAAEIVVRKSFNTGKWYFTGFPYAVSSIYYQGTTNPVSWGNGSTSGDIYVKRYNGNLRATNGPVAGVWDYFTPLSLTANRGYILWSHNNNTYDFVVSAASKGQIFNSSASYTVSQYASGETTDMSWNLVTNPFVTSFNLAQASQGPYYIYNSLSDNYQVFMPGAAYDLTPNTAFFLQAQTTSLSFSSAGRKLMPSAVANDYAGYEEMNLTLSNEQYADLTRVRLQKNASEKYEIGSDAVKMYSMNSSVPQLFTKLNNVEFAVNTMPYETESFDLFVKVGMVGTYSISLSDFNLLPNCTKVILLDKEKGIETNLLLNANYTFSVTKSGTTNRFKISVETLKDNVVTQIDDTDSRIKLLNLNKAVAFEGLDSSAILTVFDISGKILIENLSIRNGDIVEIPNKGMNILELKTLNKTYNLKAIIK
jgi:hypothetical protein